MGTIIEEFVAVLDWDVDDKNVKEFSKQMTSIADMAKKAAIAIAGAATAAIGFAVITNKQVAINANLAKSVGLSAESFDAWEGLLKQIGFEGENVIDLVEEMNNKIGEFKGLGEFTAVEESLQILGIGFKELKDLAPEAQFLKIMSTAKDLRDQQKAVSAVDMLMGGESNRVLGFLRTIDGDLEGIIERRMQLNLLDREAREGAIRFTAVWSDFTSLLGSIGSQFSGILGEVLTPMVDEFIKWAVVNRQLIKTNIRTFVEQLASAIKFIVPRLADFVRMIGKLVEGFGGLGGTARTLSVIFGGAIFSKAAQGAVAFGKALKTASKGQSLFKALATNIPGLGAAVGVGLALIAEDLWQFYQGNESVAGKVVDTLEEFMGASIEFFGGFVGLSKKEIDSVLIGIDNSIRVMYQKIKDFVYNTATAISRTVTNIIVGLVRWIQTSVRRISPLLGNLLKVVGALGRAGTGQKFGIRSDLSVASSPTVSQVAAQNAGQGARTSNVSVNSPITLNLPPGMSPEDVARQVKAELDRAAGWAVDSNDTGVVY